MKTEMNNWDKNMKSSKILEMDKSKLSILKHKGTNKIFDRDSNNAYPVTSNDAQYKISSPQPFPPNNIESKDNLFQYTGVHPSLSTLTTLRNVSLFDYDYVNLSEDLYLSSSSDDYMSISNDHNNSAFDNSNYASKLSCPVNPNYSKKSSNSTIYTSKITLNNKEADEKNITGNTANILRKEPVSFGQQNAKRRRKGQADPSSWKKNLRKNKRQRGEPYLSANGILRPGKTLEPSKCMGLCREKCTNKFTEKDRLEIFSYFWNIDSIEEKRQHIISLIEQEATQRRRPGCLASKRKITNKYFLTKKGTSLKQKVCQKFFLATFNISETFVRFCFKKLNEINIVEADKRGKHPPHNKKPDQAKQYIRDHIKSFPKLSINNRKGTKKEYILDTDLNLTKMYELYKIKCDEKNIKPVDISYYRMIFKTEFNIHFNRLYKEVCNTCLTFNDLNTEEKEKQKKEYGKHMKRNNTASQQQYEATNLALSGHIHFAEYCLETIFYCPTSPSELIYYKRRIPVYNFTILDFENEKRNVYCFCWHEGIGKQGVVEIGSCLFRYLKNKADGKPITLMSDTCVSNCRNIYISSLFLYCIETLNIPEINQKYCEPGHGQTDTDKIHCIIKKAQRNVSIFHPSGFYTIIRKASRKYPYNVYEMGTEDFIDIKYLKTKLIKNSKFDCQGNAVDWAKIKWLQYRKEDNKHVYYKYNLNDVEFKKIKIVERGKRLRVDKIGIRCAYDGPLPISTEKYDDLQDLCSQRIIPTQYHNFYKHFAVRTAKDNKKY